MLKVENLFLKKGSFVLHKLSFEVEKNSYFVILGKTGSGKTMLLEALAGIQKIEGSISCDGVNVTDCLPEERNFGFVYQDFILFPNMSVEKNIKYSSRYKQIEGKDELFKDLVDFLKIEHILKRDPKHLSGGEKQRVAIARAIYSKPKLLLLDEPLSAVDPTFRNSIMKSLKDIVKRYNMTIIHVTHNFREASFLAERVAVLLDGRILQIGDTYEVLNEPKNIEVAKFLGFKNIFPTKLLGFEQNGRYFSVDPIKINFGDKGDSDTYSFNCVIENILGMSEHYKVFAKVGNETFFCKVHKSALERKKLKEGQKTKIYMNKKDVKFI
ncbi:MAG: ATP-binding cassette domain-containing protein [Campylobacteraceae bacterium]|nr:ATP-binding cassette domain-containing protein [Campylobacteraceae bacterium]